MIYQTNTKLLGSVREVLRGEVNDILICKELNSPIQVFYTLLIIKDHTYVKKILEVLAEAPEKEEGKKIYLDCFTAEGKLSLLFPYRRERPMAKFFLENISLYECEQICINLVMECIASNLPPSLLYLALSWDNVHIDKDNSIFFTCFFDFKNFDGAKREVDCVRACALLIMELLIKQQKRSVKSYELISKKVLKSAYNSFPELYRDIKLTAVGEKPDGIIKKLKDLFYRNRDNLFRILLIISGTLVGIALLVFLSQMIFGDAALFRLFSHSLDKIGKESLRQ
jgi:hypothetical protein